MTGKKTYIECIRCIACFLVIVNHTQGRIFLQRTPSKTWFISVAFFFASKIAVPLFLMIMGALLLEKTDSPKKSAERIFRIAVVLFIASFLYAQPWKTGEPFHIVAFLKQLPQAPVITTFWYLYLYLGLLCLLPLLQRLASALDRNSLLWLLALSMGLMGLLPVIRAFFPGFSVCPYFTNVFFSPYIGAVFCGFYINRYIQDSKCNFFLSCASFVALTVFQVTATFILYRRNPNSYLMLDNASFLTITGSAACVFIAVKYLFAHMPPKPKLEFAVCRLGGLTFGMYLFIDLTLNLSDWIYDLLCGHMHVLPAMFLWEICIFAGCVVIAAVLKRIPVLRKWL